MRRAGLLLLSALALSSCSESPVEPKREYTANVVAVTIPEGLPADAQAVIWVHWYPNCGDEMETYQVSPDGPHSFKIRPVAIKPKEPVVCLDNVQCWPEFDSFRLRMPTSGVEHYRLTTVLGDLAFDLSPSGPVPPEHRVTVVRAGAGTPFVSLTIDYYNVARVIVGTTYTDSSGTAVSPAPCPGSGDGTIVSFQNRSDPCGYGTFLFDPVIPLCDHAYHTVAFYGRIPNFH